MKKEVAKIFTKYGEGKVEMVRGYKPHTKTEPTTAIRGSRSSINKTIGRIILDGDKEERKLIGKLLLGDYFEDWNSETKMIMKY